MSITISKHLKLTTVQGSNFTWPCIFINTSNKQFSEIQKRKEDSLNKLRNCLYSCKNPVHANDLARMFKGNQPDVSNIAETSLRRD